MSKTDTFEPALQPAFRPVTGSFSSMVILPDLHSVEGLKAPQPQILGPKLHLRLDAFPNFLGRIAQSDQKGMALSDDCIRSGRGIGQRRRRNQDVCRYRRPSRLPCAQDPSAPALLAPGRPALTYGELGALIQHLVRTLRGLGIAPADRIAVALPRGADSALALIAVASSRRLRPRQSRSDGRRAATLFQRIEADGARHPGRHELTKS